MTSLLIKSKTGATRGAIIILGLVIAAACLFLIARPGPDDYLAETEPPSSPGSLPSLSPGMPYRAAVAPRPDTRKGSEAAQYQQLLDAIQESLQVERLPPSGDPDEAIRSQTRKSHHQVKSLINKARRRGLKGEDLYRVVQDQIAVDYGPEALKILDSYRLLEEELAGQDLRDMTPSEIYDFEYAARRRAFGHEVAEMLFYEDEAYARYHMARQEILDDPAFTEGERQDRILDQRRTLKVELASKGTYVTFGDEARKEVNQRLREKYGDRVDTMTSEENIAAILDVYQDEIPQDIIESAERILQRARARREASAPQDGL